MNNEKELRKKISPKDDAVFKRLFGSLGSERILKGLLEAILETKIEDVDLDLRQEFLPEVIEEGRRNLLDIRVTFNGGTHAYIEMQRACKKNIGVRSLFYWARAFSSQAEKGDKELESLKKTIGIWILDEGIYFPESGDYHNVIKMNNENGKKSEMFESIELHFFELHKLRNSAILSPREIDYWMWFIDHTDEGLIEMAERSVEEIKEAVKKLRELESDRLVSELAFKEQLAEMEYNSDIKAAKSEGRAEGETVGRAEGEIDGIAKEKNNIAKNMKAKGMDTKIIAELTGLSQEEVEKL